MTDTWTVAAAPGAVPLLGHALRLRKGLLSFLESLSDAGDLVQIRIGPWQAYVVCHPDLTQHVLLHDRIFDKGGPLYDTLRQTIGNGVVTCPYAEHRRQRRLLQPAFRRDRLPGYAQVMTEQIGTVMGSWRENQVIDVPFQMRAFTSRILSKAMFAAESATPTALAVEESFDDLERGSYRHMITPPMLRRLPTPVYLRFQRARARLRAAVIQGVQDYRRTGIDHADVLSALLAAQDDQGRSLADSEIHDQVVTMVLAGTETTATGLSWALDLLPRYPEVLEKLYAEVDTVLSGRIADWNDLPNLEFTNRVVTEALRLYPPAWILTRLISADTELAGKTLPAGTTLIYSPYLIHHRADLYPEPDRFDPDRWLPEHSAHRPRNAYIPFGAGVRRCLGEAFSMAEATLILASIAAQWQLTHTTNTAIRPVARADLAPRGLRMRLHRRGPSLTRSPRP